MLSARGKQTSNIRMVTIAGILLLGLWLNLHATTLNPDQTVNPVTGQMGFSLPIGVVQGVNGHDFPITLNYSAGSRPYDAATPVGLGFSYGAGAISRTPIFVPDNNNEGSYSQSVETPCEITGWKKIIYDNMDLIKATGGLSEEVCVKVMIHEN